MQIVDYKTRRFGIHKDGTIISCYKLIDFVDGTTLIFSPKDQDGCGCLILTQLKDGYYQNLSDNSWQNLPELYESTFRQYLYTLKPIPLKLKTKLEIAINALKEISKVDSSIAKIAESALEQCDESAT